MASGHCMISGRSPGVGMDSNVMYCRVYMYCTDTVQVLYLHSTGTLPKLYKVVYGTLNNSTSGRDRQLGPIVIT